MPNVLSAGQILSILVSAWLLVGDPRNASKIGEQADAEDYHADDVKAPSPRVPPGSHLWLCIRLLHAAVSSEKACIACMR